MYLNRQFLLILFFAGLSVNIQAQEQSDSVDIGKDRILQYKLNFYEGLHQKLQGDPESAIRYFENCLELFPDSSGPCYELGSMYYLTGDYQTADVFARKAWELKPDNNWYGQMAAETQVKLGNLTQAADIYGHIFEKDPTVREYLLTQVDLLLQAEELDRALKIVEENEKKADLKRWSVLKSHDIYTRMLQAKKGQKKIKKYLEKEKDDVEARGILAESFAASGLDEEAEKQYEVLKEQAPDNPAVRFSYAQFLDTKGRKKEALSEYLRGFRSGDVNPVIKIRIVMDYMNNQEQQDSLSNEVVQLLDTLYHYEKGHPEVDGLYANYLYNEQRFEEAIGVYDRVLEETPGNFIAWQNQLFALNELQQYGKMVEVSVGALEVFPNQPLFHLFRGVALIETESLEEAIVVLKKGMKIPTQNLELKKQFYVTLADALYSSGAVEEAFVYFEDILALDPNHVIVLNNYSYYLALKGEKLDKALEMIKKCIQIEHNNPTYLDTYAWVLFRSGQKAEALSVMKDLFATDHDHSAEVLDHYGDILMANGQKEKAIIIWEQALEKDPDLDGLSQKILDAKR